MPTGVRFGLLIGLLLAAQIEDLVTASHMLDRFGISAERGLLAIPAYVAYGIPGLVALKISLVALVLGNAALLVSTGNRRMRGVAVALILMATSAGVLGAVSNLPWVLRA